MGEENVTHIAKNISWATCKTEPLYKKRLLMVAILRNSQRFFTSDCFQMRIFVHANSIKNNTLCECAGGIFSVWLHEGIWFRKVDYVFIRS